MVRGLHIKPPVRLYHIMLGYREAIGLGCGFCHAAHKTIPDSLDYASDSNKMKLEPRRMIRMTLKLNVQHFNFKKEKNSLPYKALQAKPARGEHT